MNKSTKIIATIGPASSSVKTLSAMVEAGMNVARVNFSHGTHASNGTAINNIKLVSRKFSSPVMILADLQGPKIRVGELNESIPVIAGQMVTIGKDFEMDTDVSLWAKAGHKLLIEDGLLEFKILKIQKKTATKAGRLLCEALNSGEVRSRKTINLPDTDLQMPGLTLKDIKDLRFALTQDIDYIAISFVRSAKDVLETRRLISKYLPKGSSEPKIMIKIERPEGVSNFDEILKVADAVMIARGDLGVELPAARVPVIQKQLVHKCLSAAKPVIVATQMLQSMVENPRPTRAEVSDVANAVLDRADCVMLSGETATGNYPVESVRVMTSIIQDVEDSEFMARQCLFEGHPEEANAAAVALSACELSRGVAAEAIIGVTDSGFTARFLSHQRPKVPIYMLSSNQTVCRQMQLLWGVTPVLSKRYKNILDLIDHSVEEVKLTGLIKQGDRVVVVAGRPIGGRINIVEVKIVE